VAPNHVNNFIELGKKGFYDGTIFHRVIPGFMIQGGDPNTKNPDRSQHGMGGPGYAVKAEFNEKPHRRGTLSMARAANPDSAGSQFFICVADAPFLNKQYTAFGEVVAGMEVADKIVSQPRDKRDNPNDRIEMKVKIIEAQQNHFSPWPSPKLAVLFSKFFSPGLLRNKNGDSLKKNGRPVHYPG